VAARRARGAARRDRTELEPAKAREQAITLFSQMVGALVISRAVAQAAPALSNEILAANRRQLKQE
jgi:TetR/AcrR family transcriptional regulator, transcriptional repressor for nem operon